MKEKLARFAALCKEKAGNLRRYWKTPPEKKYVSYREIAAYSVGGAGVYFIVTMVGLIVLNAGSMIVGASIGITALDLQTMNVAATLVGLVFAPMRAMLFDNTRSSMGKFRPYLLSMGLPTAFLGTLLVYLPYESMSYRDKAISVFVVYTLLQIFSPFYSAAYAGLVQVMSPNSSERAWIIEVSSIIYSAAPTIINPVLPLIGPLDDLRTYRIAFPVFCLLGVAVSMLCVFGTRERIIVPKRYVPRVGFWEGFKKVSHNKYFWIINLSTWLNFLAGGYGYLFQWIFYYGMNNAGLYSLMVVIRGEAATPGMLLGAPLANKLGKRRICLLSMAAQVVCLVLMLVCYKSYTLVFIMIYLKDMFSALSIIYLPAMKADVMEYQQYKTGDRLEGFIEQSGVLLGNAIALVTGYAIPLILQRYGLTNNYEDLFNAEFRNPIVYAMIAAAIAGTVLSLLPFLFYDLSEEKRQNMIRVLKIRALFTDDRNGELSDEALCDTVEEVYAAYAAQKETAGKTDKASAAKREAAQMTIAELEKFSTDEMRERVARAQRLVEAGLAGLRQFDRRLLTDACAMPRDTKEQRRARKAAVLEARALQKSAALLQKRFPEGAVVPTEADVEKAYALPETTRAERRAKRRARSAAERAMHRLTVAAAPYMAAKKLLEERDAYSRWPELEARYRQLKA